MRLTALHASLCLFLACSAAIHSPRQQPPGFPSCANDCLNNPANLEGCQPTDETCLCKSLPFVQTTFACILAACNSTADQQSAIAGAESLCLDFGVTLTAESSAIVAGLSTIASGATTTGGPSQSTSSTPAAAPSTGSGQQLAGGLFVSTALVVGMAAALSV
ncbi:hypothetical protein R3P38DRAFT_2829216 [Favolaschia claudopus]|uniref:CFEM domain-containing protein n=1 Tax=Favolaschia claudopus TaxID=2862362 RepID=A0AAW0EB02_9AGAR